MKKYRTVALIAREPGLRVLQDVLLCHPRLDIVEVFTHRQLKRHEGGGERPEFQNFVAICQDHAVPLQVLEYKEARDHLADRLPTQRIDFLFVLSWLTIIPPRILDRLCLGGVNIHRGALPDYAGLTPVQRAIEAGERRVAVTAMDLAPHVDVGDPLAVAWLQIGPLPDGVSSGAYAETIKQRLLPFYAPLSRLAIDLRLASFEAQQAS